MAARRSQGTLYGLPEHTGIVIDGRSTDVIESRNPEIDVDALLERVRRTTRGAGGLDAAAIDFGILALRSSVTVDAVEMFLNIAEERSQPRNKWPGHLAVFPFSRSRRLRSLALTCFNFLFRDQRHINDAFSLALREQLLLNRVLAEQIERLRVAVSQLSEQNGRSSGGQ